MVMDARQFLVVFSVLLCIPVSLQWGQEGHSIIAQIAADRLSAQVTATIAQFIGSETLAEIAPLPDDYDHTTAGRWSAPCHYADLPRGSVKFEWSYCPDFCVVKSIGNYSTILQSEVNNIVPCDFTNGIEPCALEFLVHYVGDVHQPLHVGYADDEGGNTVKADFFGKKTNLHAVWDTSIIVKWNNNLDSAVEYLENMIKQEPDLVDKYLSDMNPVDWATESHGYVISTVYNYTSKSNIAQIGQEYYDTNLPIIEQRLIAAGVRLAQLLTTLLS